MRVLQPSIEFSDDKRQEIISLQKKRYSLSKEYFQPKHEVWVRCYKIYRALADTVDDPDEINLFIPLAFGIIEDIVARLTEPILQKFPIKPVAKSLMHTKAGENFLNLVKTYFSTSQYQIDLINSERQRIITGNTWEKDEWASEWVKGTTWEKRFFSKVVESVQEVLGKIIPIPVETKFQKWVEVPKLYPKYLGYRTRFLSVFLVWPEPNVKNVSDMHWIIEEEKSVALDDLRKQKYTDENGQLRNVYDLSEIDKYYGEHKQGAIQPQFDDGSPYYDEIVSKLGNRNLQGNPKEDMDRVHLLHISEPDKLITIANGKWIIKYIENPWHKPMIPYRLKIYTQDPENLYGIGAIEPNEHLFYELNDIHRLSMRSWIRIIQGLIVYHKDAVPFADDWKPRAGGRVRIDPGISPNIHQVIANIPLKDPSQEMILHESNIRGIIERVISIADLSPGTSGTKQYHKTASGLIEIQNSLAKRFAIMRRIQLSSYLLQLQRIYDMCMQFMFEPLQIKAETDGKTIYPKVTRDDIWAGEEGFDFVIQEDPSFGDNVVQRNQLMVLLEILINYETFRMKTGDKDLLKVRISEVIKRLIEAFGWTYSAELLEPSDNALTPDMELEMILNGMPVKPNPKENLIAHLIDHMVQLMSPRIQEGSASGQIKPEQLALLKTHIDETAQMITSIMQNPAAVANMRMQEVMQVAIRNQQNIQAPSPKMPQPNTGATKNPLTGVPINA